MDNILTLFVRDTGIFSRFLQFETISMIIILLFIITYYFKNNYGFVIILLVFVLYITNIYVGLRRDKLVDFNKETELYLEEIRSVVNETIKQKLIFYNNSNGIKLSESDIQRIYELNKLDYMYIDASMIRFIHSFLDIHVYTHRGFLKFIKGVNNILKIRGEIEDYYNSEGIYPENISEMFETAIVLRRNTLNTLHNFSYSLPRHTKMYKYLDDIVERYNVLISRNLDIIQKYYLDNIKKNGINTTTKFITYNKTKPYDRLENHAIKPHEDGHNSYNSHIIPYYY